MIGVDRTESKSRAKAAKSSTDSGVAGRNMATEVHTAQPCGGEGWRKKRRRPQDAAGEGEAPSRPFSRV
jgi:hypothetical protein